MARAAVAAFALLSIGEGLRMQDTADACACKNWREVYSTAGVKCGQTNEFYFAHHKHSLDSHTVDEYANVLGPEFCGAFYGMINDNFCANVNMGGDAGQWCYVDASCSDLAGGEKVNDKVSWKLCSSKKDRLLRDYDPPALAQFSNATGLNLGLLNKMSYPLAKYRWKYVSSYWGASMDELKSIPEPILRMIGPTSTFADVKDELKGRWGKKSTHIDEEMTAELKKIADSNVPTTFDTSKDKHPPHVVVQGQTVYVVWRSMYPILLCVSGPGCKK